MKDKGTYKIFALFVLIAIICSILVGFDLVGATSVGPYKIGDHINITQACNNKTSFCDYCNISSINVQNSTTIASDVEMTKRTSDFYYNLTLTEGGTWIVNWYCGTGTEIKTGYYSFLVTSTGFELTSANSIVYIILFAILIFVFFMTMFFINKLPSDNNKDEEGRILSINYLKHLRLALWLVLWMLFVAMLYLSSNLAFAYLGERLFAQTLFVLFRISFGVTPLIFILIVVWMFVKMFHDKQLQKLLNRGFFPQGRL